MASAKDSSIMRGKVWVYHPKAGKTTVGSWHFVTLPKKQSALIKERFKGATRGFGSVPVTVTIGKTTFKTSIFPSNELGAYILPLKASVRKSERIQAGNTIMYRATIMSG